MKSHTCKITPLKKSKWFKKSKDAYKNDYVFVSQHLSNMQVYRGRDEKYFEISNGSIAEQNKKTQIYDVATRFKSPKRNTEEDMARYSCIAIIQQKIFSDLSVFEKLFDEMGIKGNKITLEDVAKYLINPKDILPVCKK